MVTRRSQRDDEPGQVLRDSLALLTAERTRATRQLRSDPAPVLTLWGAVWLIGFGLLYLSWPGGPGPLLPRPVAAAVLGLLLVAAIVLSVARGLWRQRGLDGPARRRAVLYTYSWPLALAGLWAIDGRLSHDGVPAALRPLLWSGSSLLVIGLLLLAGGLLADDRVQLGLGAWTLVVGVASVFAGVPGNFAVLAVAGSAGLLVAAARSRAGAQR